MEFLWECMGIAWKGMIGFFLWTILFVVGGTIIAKIIDLMDRIFLRSLIDQMKKGKNEKDRGR